MTRLIRQVYHPVAALGMFLATTSLCGQGKAVDHWETILKAGSTCGYLVPETEVDPGWRAITFDDSWWFHGPGGVGYGDGDDGSAIDPAISVFCRYPFQVPDTGVITRLILDVDFDDGFIAYLNGTEVGRYNLGAAGEEVSWSRPADGLHEAGLYRDMEPYRVGAGPAVDSLLVPGNNVLAIQVHNQSLTSSDLTSTVFLHAGMTEPGMTFSEPPEWFHLPVMPDTTSLPLIYIETSGLEIPNEPRIGAHMGIVDNGPGSLNVPGDPFNGYDGRISIELRGESTRWLYPKKSYSLETQTDSGTNNNISLLGLPVENDFVLYGPYGDKSLIRNILVYSMFERFDHYAPRTRTAELVVNGDYKGLYLLTEKIKRDKNRVDIARIRPEDTTATEISGGYILRVDKLTDLPEEAYWESTVDPPVPGYYRFQYQYFDPEYDELIDLQKDYIKGYLDRFETALVDVPFTDTVNGYRAYLHIPSFLDLMILNEFSKDVDGFRLSHYFYKQKDTNGGKLVSGPPWDYNLTFGNSDYTADVHETFNWTYTLTNTIYWWAWIMEDPWFRNRLWCRWEELYSGVLSPEEVTLMIDTTLASIREVIPRNYQRWPILGEYVWPNWFIGQSYGEEEEFLRNWINVRLQWMEGQWGGRCIPAGIGSEALILSPSGLRVFPNPSDLSGVWFTTGFSSGSALHIRILNLEGQVVFRGTAAYRAGERAYPLPDLHGFPQGIYILEVIHSNGFRENARIVRQ